MNAVYVDRPWVLRSLCLCALVAACQSTSGTEMESASARSTHASPSLPAVAKEFSVQFNRDVRVSGTLTPKGDRVVADVTLAVHNDARPLDAEYFYTVEVASNEGSPIELGIERPPEVVVMYTLAPKPGWTWSQLVEPTNAVEINLVVTRVKGAAEEARP